MTYPSNYGNVHYFYQYLFWNKHFLMDKRLPALHLELLETRRETVKMVIFLP